MRVEKVTLYKTPLDIEHTKVIDVYTNNNIISEYIHCLCDYSPLNINLTITKSIKVNNKRSNLVIEEDYTNIVDYNYCCINDKYFFFIEDITSLNDNDLRPSSSLSLLWDYWANNLNSIKNDNSLCDINTRHINRFNDDKSYKYYINNIPEMEHINTPIYLEQNFLSYKSKVLFLKILFNPNVIENKKYSFIFDGTLEKGSTTEYVHMENTDIHCVPRYNNIYCLYIPLKMINDEITDYSYFNLLSNFSFYYDVNQTRLTQNINKKIGFNGFFITPKDSEDILSCELTFITPFDYTIENVNDVKFEGYPMCEIPRDLIKCEVYDDYTGSYDLNFKLYGFMIPRSVSGENLSVLTGSYNINPPTTNMYLDYATTLIDNVNNTPLQPSDYYDDDNLFDVKLLQYPFNYFSLLVNDDEIILSPKSFTTKSITCQVSQSSPSPIFTIFEDVGRIEMNGYSFISNTGGLSFTSRAIDEYFSRNGATYKTTLMLKKINDVMNLGTSVFGGISSGIKSFKGVASNIVNMTETYALDKAFKADMKNRNNIIVNVPYAEFDLYKQDKMILLFNSIIDNNTLNQYKTDLYLYGYEINSKGNPFDRTRLFFDYVRTNNCKLDMRINIEDRNEIENMFNRGVHIFHYDTINHTFKSSLSLDTKGYTNKELIFLEEE